MRLINTIEISPFSYANQEYELPNGSKYELPEKWYHYWKKSISDKNLGRLEPTRKDSFLVDIETINDNELEEILKNELKWGTDLKIIDRKCIKQ